MDGEYMEFIIRYCVYLCYIIKLFYFFFVVINLNILIYYEYLSYKKSIKYLHKILFFILHKIKKILKILKKHT
jgi:hypothetical protein